MSDPEYPMCYTCGEKHDYVMEGCVAPTILPLPLWLVKCQNLVYGFDGPWREETGAQLSGHDEALRERIEQLEEEKKDYARINHTAGVNNLKLNERVEQLSKDKEQLSKDREQLSKDKREGEQELAAQQAAYRALHVVARGALAGWIKGDDVVGPMNKLRAYLLNTKLVESGEEQPTKADGEMGWTLGTSGDGLCEGFMTSKNRPAALDDDAGGKDNHQAHRQCTDIEGGEILK